MTLSSGMRALVAAASLVIIVAGLKVAAPIMVPLSLSIFLAIITMPVVAWLRRKGLPAVVSIPAVILMMFVGFGGLISVATQSLNQMRLAFPRYVARFEAMEAALTAWLRQRGVEIPASIHTEWVNADWLVNVAGGALVGVAGFMTTALVVLIVTIFLLLEVNGLPMKIRAAFGAPDLDLSRFTAIVGEVQRYLAIKTALSLVTGLLVGLWVWLLGVDFPIFWGLVAFLFNYVPNVGSVVAAGPPILLALVQLGIEGAALTALGYLVVNVVIGNLVEPSLMGRKLGLSTAVVMVSLVSWGYVWGPIGMLLSLPLTMIVRIMLENTESYRWVAVLLGPSPGRESIPAPAAAGLTGAGTEAGRAAGPSPAGPSAAGPSAA